MTTRSLTPEWVLSFVMPPDRAAATAGDLMELARARCEFWTLVARTLAGTVVRQMTAAPGETALAGISGVLLMLASYAILFFVAMAALLAGTVAASIAQSKGMPWPDLGFVAVIAEKLAAVSAWSVLTLWVPFEVARNVARSCRGKELAACAAIAMAGVVCLALARLLELIPTVVLDVRDVLPWPGYWIPMLAGAVVARRRALRLTPAA